MSLEVEPEITILFPKWIIPMSVGFPVLQGHAIVLKQSQILALLLEHEAKERYPDAHNIYLPEHALIPGLINAHCHAAMSLLRGLADDVPLMTWLNQYIWPAEKHFVSERFVREGSLLASAEMLKSGITCYADMYFHPNAIAESARKMGLRVHIGLVVMDFATTYARDADEYLQKGLEFRDQCRDQALLTTCLAPHAPYTVSDATLEQIMTYAEQLDIGIHIHLHETKDEIIQSMDKHGLRPIARLQKLGVLGPNLLAVHCVHLTEQEIALLQSFGCSVAHCPSSNLKLASGIAPVRDMLNAGLNVAVGTDGAASNNRLDVLMEARTASLLAKGVSQDSTAMPAMQALAMSTIQGAKALGLDQSIGSLEPGKLADMTAIRMDALEALPCFDPVSHLIYVIGREQVSHVWVNGVLCYEQAADLPFKSIEMEELKEIGLLWQSKIAQFKQTLA